MILNAIAGHFRPRPGQTAPPVVRDNVYVTLQGSLNKDVFLVSILGAKDLSVMGVVNTDASNPWSRCITKEAIQIVQARTRRHHHVNVVHEGGLHLRFTARCNGIRQCVRAVRGPGAGIAQHIVLENVRAEAGLFRDSHLFSALFVLLLPARDVAAAGPAPTYRPRVEPKRARRRRPGRRTAPSHFPTSPLAHSAHEPRRVVFMPVSGEQHSSVERSSASGHDASTDRSENR